MKITKRKLRQIIREEAQRLREQKIKAQSHSLLKEQEPPLHDDGELELDGEGTDFADEMRQRMGRSDSGPLKKTVVPPSERGLTAKTKQNLDKQIAGYLSKGYKKVDTLPQLPGLKVGLKASYAESDHLAIFKDFPIVIVFEKSICKRSCSPNRPWWVEEKEFKKLVGTDAGFANNKVYAVLAKEVLDADQKKNKFLEKNYVKPLIDKGYKHMTAFPRNFKGTGGKELTTGLKINATLNGYRVSFEGFDNIMLITADGIRGRKQFPWTVEEKEFNQLVGNKDPAVGTVYALLVK